MSGQEALKYMTNIEINEKQDDTKPTPIQLEVTTRTEPKLHYAFTIPGLLKLIQLVLNFVALCTISTYGSYGCWRWLFAGCCFFPTAFLFILYAFNLINREDKLVWKFESIYYAVWTLLIFFFGFVISARDGVAICVVIIFTYIIDSYIKCYGWMQNDFSLAEKNIFNLQKTEEMSLEVVNKPTLEPDNIQPQLEESQNSWKTLYYLKCLTGQLKLSTMILNLLSFFLTQFSWYSISEATLSLGLATFSGFFITGILIIFYTFNILNPHVKTSWKLEYIYSFLWAGFVFSTSIAAVIGSRQVICAIIGEVVGFITAVIYAVDGGLKFDGYRKNIKPTGNPPE